MVDTEEETLVKFPCEFPIKVMGAATSEFQSIVNDIAKKHDADYVAEETTTNTSKTGKYLSLTLNIHAKSKPQLDALYQDLTGHELVLWVL